LGAFLALISNKNANDLIGSLIDGQKNPLFIILISEKRPEFVTLDHELAFKLFFGSSRLCL